MKVGDLVKYTERRFFGGYEVESSLDLVEWQKKAMGFGIIIAAGGAMDRGSPETVVVWWPKLGEAWEPVGALEIISESKEEEL